MHTKDIQKESKGEILNILLHSFEFQREADGQTDSENYNKF